MENRSVFLQNIQFILFCLIIIFQLFGWPLGVNLILSLFSISIFFHPNFKAEVSLLFKNYLFLISLIPFLLYSCSLLFTHDIHEGVRNVTTKLPLLLFPFLLNMIYNPKSEDIWDIAKLFVWGVALMGIIGFCIQYQEYVKTGDTGYFYNDNLGNAFGKQAAYFAWYTNTAICILVFGWGKIIREDQRFSFFGSILLLVLIGTQILLASRTSLAIMIFILLFFGLHKLFRGFSRKKIALVFLIISATITATIILFPKVLNRFKGITQISYRLDNPNPLNHFNGTYSNENWDGLSARLAIWECSWSAIKKQPILGAGVGDVPTELRKVYQEKNFILGQTQDFNTHNQFLDVWLATGIFGLILFISALFIVIKKTMQHNEHLLTALWLILILSMLTENILNRNQGVMIVGILIGFTVKILSCNRLTKI